LSFDPTDQKAGNRYRIACGEAARLKEAPRFDHSFGRDFAARVEEESGAILAEVRRRCPSLPAELVELAVADVMAGRRPRW
jgi:hypothetical protein